MNVVPDSRIRRVGDIALGSAGMLVMAIPMTAIAFAIRMTSSGPAIFRQERVGRDGVSFTLYKFRSMRVGPSGSMVSGEDDPRVTPIGRWMRARRIDELPQLVNLLRGDVTLIGPRPEVARFVEHYTEVEMRSLDVRPGIIGPGAILFAQEQASELEGAADPDRLYIDHHLHAKLALDLDYLQSRGLRRDVSLLLTALGIAGRGAV